MFWSYYHWRQRTHETSLTNDEKDLHQDVTDARGVARCGAAVLPYLHRGEADVVGNGDGHVEGGQQDQPIPAGLERTVVKEDEARLLDLCYLVFWDGVRIGSEDTLDHGTHGKHTNINDVMFERGFLRANSSILDHLIIFAQPYILIQGASINNWLLALLLLVV